MAKKIIIFIGKWLSLVVGLLAAILLAWLNFQIIQPWFSGNGPLNLGSIEVSYVSMARFLVEFKPHLSFAPYWYFGFPFNVFYTPLLPFLEAIFFQTQNLTYWQAYRLVTGAGFILAPVSLSLLAWYLTKKVLPAFVTGLAYTFLPTIFDFILSSGEVAQDSISKVILDPRRLVILARWGEGPHILALVFLPLAGLFFSAVLKKPKPLRMFLTALFISLTAMTNAVALYGLLILLLAIFFSQWVAKPKDISQNLKLSLFTGLLTYGLIAWWYNLPFIKTFFSEGSGVVGNYIAFFPWGYLLFLGVGIGLWWVMKKINFQPLTISLVWVLIIFAIVYIYYTSAPPEFSEQRLEFAPQALRLMTEVDMGLSLFLGCLLAGLTKFLEKKHWLVLLVGNLLVLVLAGGLVGYGLNYLPYGRQAVYGSIDLGTTAEAEIAQWLNEKVDQKKGERVFLAGNYAFYLNYFTNIWQLRGALYQAKTHWWPEHIYYQLNHGKSKDIALAWLKISNIRYLVVNTPTSRELFKDFKVMDKFDDLKLVWENRGDLVYEVPLLDSAPVKIVNRENWGKLETPKKADDKEPILAYNQALDQSKQGSFEVINNDTYQLKAKLEPGEAILVQLTYDLGFKAKSNLGRVKVTKDVLGFILLIPGKAGEQEITLSHGRSFGIWLGYIITLITIGIFIYWAIIKNKK